MKTHKHITIAFVSASFIPMTALAQGPNLGYLTTTASTLNTLFGTLVAVVITLGLVIFLWGLVVVMMGAGSEDSKQRGKRLMFWGIIILFVMVSVWGLVALLGSLTGIGQGGTITAPQPAS